MNIQARLYYPFLITFSLLALVLFSVAKVNAVTSLSLLVALFIFCLYGVSIEKVSLSYVRSIGIYLREIVGVVSILFPLALYIKAAEVLVATDVFHLETLLNFQIGGFLILLPVALCLYAIFALNIFIYRSFITDLNSGYRIAFTTVSCGLIYTLLYYTIGFHVHPLIFLMAIASYFFLLDLFVERYYPSIVWTVLWNVMLCSYMSLILFAATNASLKLEGLDFLPLFDGLSFFSICFVFSSVILFLVSRLAEWKVFDNSILGLFKRRKMLQDRIQYSIIGILIFSFAVTAVISIFYFKSFAGEGQDFELINTRFIHALMNAHVFLFLIGFVLVITISSYITRPMSNLGSKLQQIKLSHKNEPIEWGRNDEIGALINEYNSMIRKLESNAKVLAQTERDTAWREMARQVAHEIKNPLTPMKLSLQHMQRAVHMQEREGSSDIVDRMCNTLMEQIDNLSQISDEFSNFASLPSANNSKVLLNEVVETVHDLFRKRDDMDINMVEPIDDVIVYADKNNMIRILNNLIKNAIQAIPPGRRGKIGIKLYKDDAKGTIEVTDNGIGIPDHMKNKIFKPNFTTKSSGTGLGLAIAANMVESFGGNIYFESKGTNGSTFFIEIPLKRIDIKEKEKNLVLLED